MTSITRCLFIAALLLAASMACTALQAAAEPAGPWPADEHRREIQSLPHYTQPSMHNPAFPDWRTLLLRLLWLLAAAPLPLRRKSLLRRLWNSDVRLDLKRYLLMSVRRERLP